MSQINPSDNYTNKKNNNINVNLKYTDFEN